MLSLRGHAIDGPARARRIEPDDVDTVIGDTGLVMNPAQAPAFFARSSSWRCTGCGKVHFFGQLVPVAVASPCTCASIEFEPQRDLAFAPQAFSPLHLSN
ncbi:MAG: hypothetical protein ABI641_06460 [Caldimonas sp.]